MKKLLALSALVLLPMSAFAQSAQYPAAVVTTAQLPSPGQGLQVSTTLSAGITSGATVPFTVTVGDNSDFPAVGYFAVGAAGDLELMRYDSKPLGTTFNVVERAIGDTTATTHDIADTVAIVTAAVYVLQLNLETMAIQTELGADVASGSADLVTRLAGIEAGAGGPRLTLPEIEDTSADHRYILAVSELAADRTITLPLLAGNDTFAFLGHAQTWTADQTFAADILADASTRDIGSSGTPFQTGYFGTSVDTPRLTDSAGTLLIDSSSTLAIKTTGAATLELYTNNTGRWFVGSTGHWTPWADATYDVGSAAARVAEIHGSDFLAMGTNPATTGTFRLANNSPINARNFGDTTDALIITYTAANRVQIGDGASPISINPLSLSFFGVSPVSQPTITGSRGGNAALADLLTKLALLGLIVDSTS